MNSNKFNKPSENLKQNLLSPNKNDSLNLAVTDLTKILIHLSRKCLKSNQEVTKRKGRKMNTLTLTVIQKERTTKIRKIAIRKAK